jgi:hypothetical protein
VLAMLPPRPGVTIANFDRIEEGMTRAEVEALLGEPRVINGPAGHAIWIDWVSDEGRIIATRFDNDKLVEKSFHDQADGLIDKLRRWMGFAPACQNECRTRFAILIAYAACANS